MNRSRWRRLATMRRTAGVLALGAAAVSTAAEGEMATITPLRDNTLFEDEEGDISNGAGPVLFVGSNSQLNTRRAVLVFDIASAVPSESIIDSVRFSVEVSNTSPSAPSTSVSIHRITREWGEGSSTATGGSGATATAGDATWLHTFYPDLFWNSPGGDFDATALAVATLGDVGTYSWASPALTASAQAWLDNAGSNFGWLLQGDESAASTARRLESREAASAATRPTLLVYYSAPSPSHETTWGDIKTRWRRR